MFRAANMHSTYLRDAVAPQLVEGILKGVIGIFARTLNNKRFVDRKKNASDCLAFITFVFRLHRPVHD